MASTEMSMMKSITPKKRKMTIMDKEGEGTFLMERDLECSNHSTRP